MCNYLTKEAHRFDKGGAQTSQLFDWLMMVDDDKGGAHNYLKKEAHRFWLSGWLVVWLAGSPRHRPLWIDVHDCALPNQKNEHGG